MNSLIEWNKITIDLDAVDDSLICYLDSLERLVVINKNNFTVLKFSAKNKPCILNEINEIISYLEDINGVVFQLVRGHHF